MDNPRIQQSQIVFGDIIYWLTITAAMFCIIGPVVAFASMDGNILNPHYLFANIWSGMGPEAIWEAAGKANGGGHYWVRYLTAGDGFMQLGLVIGCCVAMPAMLAAALIYVFKEKSFGWALGALWVAVLVTISVLGIVSV